MDRFGNAWSKLSINTIVKQQTPVSSGAFAEEGSGGTHLETSNVQSNIFKHV